MASIDSQFSGTARQNLLDRASGLLLARVAQDISSQTPDGSPAEYLECTRQLVNVALQFDKQHAKMRLLAARNGTPATGPNPFSEVAQVHLIAVVNGVLDDIGGLLSAAAPQAGSYAAKLVSHERASKEWLIRRQYGEQEVQHELELEGERRNPGEPTTAYGPKPKRKRKNGKAAFAEAALRDIASRLEVTLKKDFPDADERHSQLVERLLSHSDERLLAPVNEELAKQGRPPVCTMTIRRTEIYRRWEQYRHPPTPESKPADCGPAFNNPGFRAITTDKVATADLMTSNLTGRSRRRVRSNGRGGSRQDQLANEFAGSLGVALDPVD